MLTISIVLMVFVFFPSAIINSYKKQAKKNYYSLHLVSYITIAIILLGALFKIQHWPGAGILILIGLPLPFILFFPLYLRYHKKTKQEYNLDFFGMVFFLLFLAVFSALLALNVSKNVLNGFALVSNNTSAITEVLKKQNTERYKMLPDTMANEISREEIIHYKELVNKLDNKIEHIKTEMATTAYEQNNQFFGQEETDYFKLYQKESKAGNYVLVVDQDYQEKESNEFLKQYEHFIKETQALLTKICSNEEMPVSAIVPKDFSPKVVMKLGQTGNNLIANLSLLNIWQEDIRRCEREVLKALQN